jgi:prepilin-type processing-associated H-X9-DG protein
MVDGPGSPGTDVHTGSPTDYALGFGDTESHLYESGLAAELRHSGKMNVLLTDGHCKTFDRAQLKTTHNDAATDEELEPDPRVGHKNPSNDGINPWWRP